MNPPSSSSSSCGYEQPISARHWRQSSGKQREYSSNLSSSTRKRYNDAPIASTSAVAASSSSSASSAETVRYKPAPPPYSGAVIPRVKPIRQSMTSQSRETSRQFDTFGENALETIYDQFKFLEENDAAAAALASANASSQFSANSQAFSSTNSQIPILPDATGYRKRRVEHRARCAFCLLPLLEIIAAIGILVNAIVGWRNSIDQRQIMTDGEEQLTIQAVDSLSTQSAVGIIIPAIFQIIAGAFGFWPLAVTSRRRASFQILHIIFNSIVIIIWFNSIYDVFYRISTEHALSKSSTSSEEKYIIDLIVGCLIYFGTVVVPSITLTVAAFNLMPARMETRFKSIGCVTISIGCVLFSSATAVISIFVAQGNLSANGKEDSSDTSLFAYGLKESIVFVFVVLVALFSLIVASQNRQSLMFSAAVGQCICLIAITINIFSSERVSSVFTDLPNGGSTTTEIGIILLNGCALATLALLIIQLAVFVGTIASQFATQPTHHHSTSLIDSRAVERTSF